MGFKDYIPTFAKAGSKIGSGASGAASAISSLAGMNVGAAGAAAIRGIGGGASRLGKADITPALKGTARVTGKAAKGVGKGVLGIGRGIIAAGEGRGIIPDWMKKLFGLGLKFTFGLLIIGIVIVSLILGFNWYQTGAGGVGATHAQVAGKEVGLPILTKLGLRDAYLAVVSPEKLLVQSSFESDIEKNAANVNLGVRIKNFEAIGKIFAAEAFSMVGTIEVESLPDAIELLVTCTMEDYQNDFPVAAEISLPGSFSNIARIHKGIKEVIQATCTFPEGVRIEDSDQVITAKQAAMHVAYNFETKASHKTYVLDFNELQKFKSGNQDPFDFYKVSDPQLTGKRTIRSKATPGPINLAIGTYQSQPFTQDTPYWLGVTIANNAEWRGNLQKLNSLELQVPDFISLESDPEFGAGAKSATCDFASTGETIQDGDLKYKVYALKDEVLEKVNKDCDIKSLKDTVLTRKICIDLFKISLDFRCRFKLSKELQSPTLTYDAIGAKAKYIYETERNAAVNVVKLPTEIA